MDVRGLADWIKKIETIASRALGRLGRAATTVAHRTPDWSRAFWRRSVYTFVWLRTSIVARRLGLVAALLTVSLAGAIVGVFATGRAGVTIGPFQSTVEVQPSTASETEVDLPPLGALILDTHTGPLRLNVSLDSLDQARTEALVSDPNGLANASETVAEDVTTGLVDVILRALAGAVIAGIVLGALLFRTMRRTAVCAAMSVALTLGTFGVAASTIRFNAIEEPRYEGLLANAPAVVGSAQQIADRYEEYRDQLQRLVTNAALLYTTARSLPVFEPDPGTIRVLHVSDLHLNPAAWDVITTVVSQWRIDVVVDTGDITDWGTEQEAGAYTSMIPTLPVPYVWIRGNHDSARTQKIIEGYSNAIVLDGDVQTVEGLTFAGIGDPRFTPDKSSQSSDVREEQVMLDSGTALRDVVEQSPTPVDVCLVHDPVSASPLAGEAPLVLSGHRHERTVEMLPDSDTRLMVQGSTGGAGLRGLEQEEPTPLELSVLYFDSETKDLQAYDDIALGGAGQSEVTLQRHVIDEEEDPAGAEDGTPAPDGS